MAVEQVTVHAQNTKEKEHQLAAAEGVAGILRAYHHFAGIGKLPQGVSEEWLSLRVVQPLLKVMMQCPAESEDAWCCALRAGLADCDPRNVQWMTRPVLEMMVRTVGNDKISPEKQVRAIRYGTEILLSFGYRGRSEWQYVLHSICRCPKEVEWDTLCHENGNGTKEEDVVDLSACSVYLANPYRSVRSDLGILLSVLVRCVRTQTSPLMAVYDCTAVNGQFASLIGGIESQYGELWRLQKEEQQQRETAHEEEASTDDDEPHTTKYNHLLQTLVCLVSVGWKSFFNLSFRG